MRTLTLETAHRHTINGSDYISLASTPNDESCTQAGEHLEDQQRECLALINQLRRMYGNEPEGAEFFILENFHDFGTYYEAAIIYKEETEEYESESQNYAMLCEDLPDTWDVEALADLRKLGHSNYQPAKVINLKRA